MPSLEERIANLSDQQALSILDSLAGEFATPDTPDSRKDQALVLQELAAQAGQEVDLAQVAANPEAVPAERAAQVARQLLLLLSQVPEVSPSLEEWLENPPEQEAAAIPLVLMAPVVLTGCIAFLNVVGHVHYKRNKDGTWELSYDPEKKTPLDNTMKEAIQILAGLMKTFGPH